MQTPTSEEINALYQLGGSAAVVVFGFAFTVWWVLQKIKAVGFTPVSVERTKVVTTDTVAMDSLSRTIEANTKAIEALVSVNSDIADEVKETRGEIVELGVQIRISREISRGK